MPRAYAKLGTMWPLFLPDGSAGVPTGAGDSPRTVTGDTEVWSNLCNLLQRPQTNRNAPRWKLLSPLVRGFLAHVQPVAGRLLLKL